MAVPWNYTLNVNLQEGAVQQLEFLKEVASHPGLDDEKVLKHSLFRYENYWLPLAGKHPNETLAAPLDVEWIWLCHMLSPVHYQRDCNLLVGRVVSHKLYSAMQRRKFQQKARSLWQVEFPQEPFHLELDSSLYYTDDDFPSKLSHDIVAAAAKQRIFNYQVCLPHFKDSQFLAMAELRYKRFLYLKERHRDVELVPSYDVDLMWHTHMLHPLAYKIDTETIMGHTMKFDKPRDDGTPATAPSPGSGPGAGAETSAGNSGTDEAKADDSDGQQRQKLQQQQQQQQQQEQDQQQQEKTTKQLQYHYQPEAFAETRELWRKAFDVNFEVCGSSYRGEPTAGKLHTLTPQQNFMASTKTATFIIEKVDVQGLPALNGKLVFKLYTGLNGKIGKCAATFKGEPPWQGKALPVTDFATETVNYLKIRVLDQTGMLACFGSREIVGEKDIDLRPTLDSLTHETSVEHSVSLSPVYGATVAHVTTHFCWPQRGPVHLYLKVGVFTQSLLPERPETMFCHVPLRSVPKAIENPSYIAASHSFVNHSESEVLTCRVLHSLDLLQSAVYVCYQDKIASMAHLVGLDQLPLPNQVMDPRKVPYLNPRAGERAVLIKNHSGDWAVVVGRWTAVRKGGSRMGSRRGKDGLPGQLMVRVRELAEFGWRELQLTYSDQHWRFSLDDLHVDLKGGTIRIDNPDSQHVAEKVALAFSVSLLHVLCMPRPSGWKRGTSLRPRNSRRGTRSSKWIPSDEMPFIVAAGVLQDTPTNSYIRQTRDGSVWTCEGDDLLGPDNTDLQACRAEDGLGGMWAHVAPGLTELFVQGSHAVPDASSGSAQIAADGNSSISAQCLPDAASSGVPSSPAALLVPCVDGLNSSGTGAVSASSPPASTARLGPDAVVVGGGSNSTSSSQILKLDGGVGGGLGGGTNVSTEQLVLDGNSGSCSQTFVDSSVTTPLAGGAGVSGSLAAGDRKMESSDKDQPATVMLHDSKTPASHSSSLPGLPILIISDETTPLPDKYSPQAEGKPKSPHFDRNVSSRHSQPEWKPRSPVFGRTVSGGHSTSEWKPKSPLYDRTLAGGPSQQDWKPKSPLFDRTFSGAHSPLDWKIKSPFGDWSDTSALAATQQSLSCPSTPNIIKSDRADAKAKASAIIVPGEKSFGISALAMLGGKMTSAVQASNHPLLRPLPSVAVVDESAACAAANNGLGATADTLASLTEGWSGLPSTTAALIEQKSHPLAEVFPSTAHVQAEILAGEDDDSADEEEEEEEEEEDDEEEKSTCSSSSFDEEEQSGEDMRSGDDQASLSSDSSFQGAVGLLGVPELAGGQFHGVKLNPRDMIDICEARIYSDYKCSLETGGVDDVIISDSKFDDADEEIIVAVQSRRNSGRKYGSGANRSSHASATATAAVVDAASGQDSTADRRSVCGGEGGGEDQWDDFASSLTAALAAASFTDVTSESTGEVKDETVTSDSTEGQQNAYKCSNNESSSNTGSCSGHS